MSLWGRWAVALLLAPVAAGGQTTPEPDPFADFRIPEHRAFSWTGDFFGSASRSDESFYLGEAEAGSVSGSLSTTGFWLWDSDPTLRQITARLSSQGFRSGADRSLFFTREESRERIVQNQWSLSYRERRYPWSVPLGFEGSLSAFGVYRQTWNRDLQVETRVPVVTTRKSRRATRRYLYEGRASVSVGVGRVRDATAVYDVLILEERLRHRGVLSGALSPMTRSKLAGLIYARSSFRLVRDRPGKDFWSSLVDLLEDDPSYRPGFGPPVVLEVLEPYFGAQTAVIDFLPTPFITRLRGFFVGATTHARFLHRNEHDHISEFTQQSVNDTLQPPDSFESAFESDSGEEDIFWGPKAEWHLPLGTRWQLDAASTLLVSAEDFGDGFQWSSDVSARWIVADRWLASVGASHARHDRPTSFGDFWNVNVAASLDWYVEDRIRLGVAASSQQTGGPASFQRFHGISLGIGYRFAGRLEAPGLIEPIRSR